MLKKKSEIPKNKLREVGMCCGVFMLDNNPLASRLPHQDGLTYSLQTFPHHLNVGETG